MHLSIDQVRMICKADDKLRRRNAAHWANACRAAQNPNQSKFQDYLKALTQ